MERVRRFFRIAFNALTVLSLVLAVLVAALWVRSQTHWDLLSVRGGSTRVQLGTQPDVIHLLLMRRDGTSHGFDAVFIPKRIDQPTGHNLRTFALGDVHGGEYDIEQRTDHNVTGTSLSVPLWFVLLLLQFYLLFPFLYRVLKIAGPFVVITLGLALSSSKLNIRGKSFR